MASPASIILALRGIEFTRTSNEIKEAAVNKVEFLRAKIVDRERRIADIRKSYEISDQDLIDLLSQANANRASSPGHYALSSVRRARAEEDDTEPTTERYIAAGVVQNILTEKQLIEQETQAITTFEFVIRNIRPIRHVSDQGVPYEDDNFRLSYEDLSALGL
jgi:hypothetical protein